MTLASVVGYYASDTQDAIDKIKDTLVSAGWTLEDTTSTNYGYVLSSSGESGNEQKIYVWIHQDTNVIEVFGCAGWDGVSHAQTYYFGNATYSHIDFDDDGPGYVWASSTKDGFIICSYHDQATEADGIVFGLFTPWYEEAIGTLASGVSSGSSVVITLGSGEADDFTVGNEYKIFNEDNRELCTVTAVNSGSDQITVDSLTYSYDSGDKIGTYPCKWAMALTDYNYAYNFWYATEGTGPNTDYNAPQNPINPGAMDPDPAQQNMYGMAPWAVYNGDNCYGGPFHKDCPFLRVQCGNTHETTISVGDIDTGTSSGSNTSTTLNDTTKSWTNDEHIGKVLIITGGTGAGQFRAITDNDGTSLTVAAWDTTPDGTSTYTICDEGWLYMYCNANVSNSLAMRVI